MDLGHLRETCDLTEFVWMRLQGFAGLPTVIPTIQGEATIVRQVPPNRWLTVAQAIAFDDALGHEIMTYDLQGPGMHNSAFSPEDLCSNFVGTVVARMAIGIRGVFRATVTARTSTRAERPARSDTHRDKEGLRQSQWEVGGFHERPLDS